MTAKAKETKQQPAQEEKPECFVIMPISDRDGYETGHFKRVYDWIIKPACEAAGYKPVRGDDVSSSHLIVADILKRIVEAPMAICDVSSLNANVMFELGIRQAFGKPVALLKDERTTSVFDIGGLRHTDYASSLRADLVKANANQLATMIKETGEANSGMTSLMSLVDIDAATIPQSADVSDDSKLILQELHKLSSRLSRVEKPAWVIEASGQKGENKYLYARKLVTKHQDSIREMSEEQLIEFANQCFHEEQIAERNVFLELAARLRAQTGLFW